MELRAGETLTGPAGDATKIEVIGEPDVDDWRATVASWFVHCPGQSVAWEHYGMSIVHLRPMPGVKEPYLRTPDSTHELLILAYDPSGNPTPLDPSTWLWLHPLNLAEQVVLPSDEAADELLRLAGGEVVAGRLWIEPPLSGQVEPWRTVLAETAAHLRGEHDA